MALIKCPECGKEVSDRAKTCIHCGCPLEEASSAGNVRIKMSAVQTKELYGKQQVTVETTEGSVIWEGEVGQIAEIYFERKTDVVIKYHLSMLHYGGECNGVIDPALGKRYNVHVRQGIFKTIMELQRVDVLDSD